MKPPYLPQEISDVTFAFPGSVEKEYMPEYKEIPEEFRDLNRKTVWNELFSKWFFSGLENDDIFIPKEGIDKKMALRHINTIMRSFQPKHEHKEASVAYLMSIWFQPIDEKSI